MTRIERVALAIYARMSGDDTAWADLSNERRQEAAEWARVALAAAGDEATRLREFWEFAAAYQAKIVSASTAYNQVIIVAGYAAFFGIWSAMNQLMPRWAMLLAGALIMLSIGVYIAWVVVGMFVTERHNMLVLRSLSEGPTGYFERAAAIEAAGTKKHLALMRWWGLVVAVAAGSAAIAATILIASAVVLSVEGPKRSVPSASAPVSAANAKPQAVRRTDSTGPGR